MATDRLNDGLNRPAITGRQSLMAVGGMVVTGLVVLGGNSLGIRMHENATGLTDLREQNADAYYGCRPQLDRVDDTVGATDDDLHEAVCSVKACLAQHNVAGAWIKVSNGDWRLHLEEESSDIRNPVECGE